MEECNILHCDANNFYASVEIAKDPSLRGKNIAVCGDPERRHGIVLAKSNGAKAKGVQTAEPIWKAKQKCPDLIVIPPDFSSYVYYSNKLFDIYTSYTDRVESFGLDECWLDLSGSHRLFGTSLNIAEDIRNRVKNELGITVSIGVSFTKVFAKLGSDYKKPDAITLIDRNNYKQIAWELPIEDLLMVGNSSKDFLHSLGVKKIGDLALFNAQILKDKLGSFGTMLQNYALGIETDEVHKYYEKRVPESIGNGCTTVKDLTKREECEAVITALSETVAGRLRKYGMHTSGVHLVIKNNDLTCKGKQIKCPLSASCTEISKTAMTILDSLWKENIDLPIRALTVTAIHLLNSGEYNQDSFLEEMNNAEKHTRLEHSVDKIREKYGAGVLKRGNLMKELFEADNVSDSEYDEDRKPFKK